MESYSKKNLKISGITAWVTFLSGIIGYFVTNNYNLFLNIYASIMGINFVAFSHDLAMNQVVKYKFNYKFARFIYLSGGILFLMFAIFKLV